MRRLKISRALGWLLMLVGLSGWQGCAHYSTSGGMIGGIRSVAFPVAENETAEFGIGEQLSERITEAFTDDGRLRVIDEESADAMMYLTIRRLDDLPFTYTASEVTEQYRFRIYIDAELVRTADMEKLLELEELEGWGTYDAALPDEEGRELAVEGALDMVIEEVVDRTTSSW